MSQLSDAIEILKSSSNIVVFTGAGVSTESNIPDFRSDRGLFEKIKCEYCYPPEVLLSHSFFMEHTAEFYDYYRNNMVFSGAKPNNCHKALTALEEIGKVKTVITQNIDGLHQAAGSKNVLELHGSIHRNYCMNCRKSFTLQYVMNSSRDIPVCDGCGAVVKPDVVLYEEILDEDLLRNAAVSIRGAEVLLVIGTSLVVYPAAGLINLYRGSRLVLINKSPTPYDKAAHIVINDSAGKVMSEIVEGLR